VIIFGSVFIKKKSNRTDLKKKPETEPKPGQTDWFRFGFLGQKQVQTDLTRFFPGFFCLGSIQFCFFGFLLIKPNRPVFSKF
jgi:hypothetical protein